MSLKIFFERFLGACVRVAITREQPLVIAIAGSVGKSSTKEAIGIAFGASESGSRVIASHKNYNNELGVPLTILGHEAPGRLPLRWISLLVQALLTRIGILRLPASTFVLELATDRPGDLAHLIEMVRPHIGVLTAIGPEHTEFFGSLEGVAHEEGTILQRLGTDDIAIVNVDDSVAMAFCAGCTGTILTFGKSEHATARIVESRMVINHALPTSSGLDITISLADSARSFRITGTVGRPQAYAVAAALAVVNAIDGDEARAIARLAEQYHGMPGRMRLLAGVKHTWLIDDSYNSSPLAALSAIQDLASFPIMEDARRIAALGDMLELGAVAEVAHREVGRAIANAGIDRLVVCGTFAHTVAAAAREVGMSDERIVTFAKSEDAGRFIQDILHEGDVVLIKGSQGARMERIALELIAHPERANELLVRQEKSWKE